MPDDLRDCLLRQLDIAWALTSYHLDGLTTEECLWRPAAKGLHVQQDSNGIWQAEWPDHEGYDLGPPSIAWLTWHIGFWWSTALDHSFGSGTLTREDVTWPATAEAARAWIGELHDGWRQEIEFRRVRLDAPVVRHQPAARDSHTGVHPLETRPRRFD